MDKDDWKWYSSHKDNYVEIKTSKSFNLMIHYMIEKMIKEDFKIDKSIEVKLRNFLNKLIDDQIGNYILK